MTKGSRHSDGWNSSDQEVKSVYSTRTTLQEVEILPTLVYFASQGLRGCIFTLRGCLAEFQNMGMLPYFVPTHWLDFRTDFQVGN